MHHLPDGWEYKTLENILKQIKKVLPELKEKYKIKSLGVFGSYVRGEQNKKSDIDILVEFNETPGFFDFIELEDELKKLLKIKVDLVSKKSLKVRIGKEILKEVIEL
ncbi:MAG: nucleotidyltransferase family protein [Spirochaetota bacterium]|nr:nucleotidyltransferase family protein [Spirochaetota bacterium]